MKVLAINGSPKKEGNTFLALKTITDILEKDGFNTELYHVGGKPVRGCVDCRKCKENMNMKCVINDYINDLITKCVEADVIILGSPVYFSTVTPELKAFIDRGGRVFRANDFALKRKIGASLCVANRAGTNATLNEMNLFFLVENMIVVGSDYWNGLFGLNPGDINKDQFGQNNLKTLAKNISWLGKIIRSA